MTDRRTYVGELEHALQMANSAHHDRNPNRYAQVQGWIDYGLAVAISRRSKSLIPERPKQENMI